MDASAGSIIGAAVGGITKGISGSLSRAQQRKQMRIEAENNLAILGLKKDQLNESTALAKKSAGLKLEQALQSGGFNINLGKANMASNASADASLGVAMQKNAWREVKTANRQGVGQIGQLTQNISNSGFRRNGSLDRITQQAAKDIGEELNMVKSKASVSSVQAMTMATQRYTNAEQQLASYRKAMSQAEGTYADTIENIDLQNKHETETIEQQEDYYNQMKEASKYDLMDFVAGLLDWMGISADATTQGIAGYKNIQLTDAQIGYYEGL